MLLDFDPDTVGIASQSFCTNWEGSCTHNVVWKRSQAEL
jgi:hypothetical protein